MTRVQSCYINTSGPSPLDGMTCIYCVVSLSHSVQSSFSHQLSKLFDIYIYIHTYNIIFGCFPFPFSFFLLKFPGNVWINYLTLIPASGPAWDWSEPKLKYIVVFQLTLLGLSYLFHSISLSRSRNYHPSPLL